PRMIYDTVRKYADYYEVDRPLSQEVEQIENDLASLQSLDELISQAPLPGADEFFALGQVRYHARVLASEPFPYRIAATLPVRCGQQAIIMRLAARVIGAVGALAFTVTAASAQVVV